MLKVNRLTGYAVMLMSTMIKNSDIEKPPLFTANGLSKDTKLPLATVIKILKQLSSAKLIKSQRGIKGGYHTLPAAHNSSFADLIEALEGPISINDCDVGKDCYIKNTCPIRGSCNEINIKIKSVLDDVKIKDIASKIK